MSASPGFTVVEVLVAAFVLTVAVLGTLALIDRANGLVTMSKQRVGAGNLAREVVEDARSLDYDSLTPTQLVPALQALPGLGGSGNPWTVTRRGIAYTVQIGVCTFDDPKDDVSATPPADACASAAGSGVAQDDPNPDDFRRVTATVTWSGGPSPGASHTVTFTSLIVNPSGGLGPRLTLVPPADQITTPSTDRIDMQATTSAPAASTHWAVDNGASGEATGGPKDWTVSWSIGSAGSCTQATGYVLDGAYNVTAQDFDERGIPGDSRVATVMLNRCLPLSPANFAGGHDTRLGGVIDLQWDRNPERDIVGYRVYDVGSDGALDPGDRLVDGCAIHDPTVTDCTDTDPTASATGGDLHYAVVALDRTDLADPSSAEREGAPSMLRVQPADGSAPSWPDGTTLTVATPDGGLPQLTWSAPATGGSGGVAFYRIYRDGAALGDRYDATAGPSTTWKDSDPGTSGHSYWVTAVDHEFNESPPLGPVPPT